MTIVEKLLRRVLSVSPRALKDYIRRGHQIEEAIKERWGATNPWQWQCKHVHWYFVNQVSDLSAATRYDHWRVAFALLNAMGKYDNWEHLLRGPWRYRTGEKGPGKAGRPPKVSKRGGGKNWAGGTRP